jgi:hypothetical protein
MERNLALTPGQRRRVRGRIEWLCATYCYADARRGAAWRHALRCVGAIPPGEAVGLLARLVLGVRLVHRLRDLLRA